MSSATHRLKEGFLRRRGVIFSSPVFDKIGHDKTQGIWFNKAVTDAIHRRSPSPQLMSSDLTQTYPPKTNFLTWQKWRIRLARQPVRGLLYLGMAVAASLVWLKLLAPLLGVPPAIAESHWPFTWFFTGFAGLAFFEKWPFNDRHKPKSSRLLSAFTYTIPAILLWEALAPRLAKQDAYALLGYAMFFLFTIGWFFHNAPVARMRQPWQGLLLTGGALAFGAGFYFLLGRPAGMIIFFVPEFLLLFFGDWPIPSQQPWRKGVFWLAIILAGSFLTHRLFSELGCRVDSLCGGDLMAVIFAAMLLPYSVEYWPYAGRKQPIQGLLLIASTLILSGGIYMLAFGLLHLPSGALPPWVFVTWCFVSILVWYIDPLGE